MSNFTNFAVQAAGVTKAFWSVTVQKYSTFTQILLMYCCTLFSLFYSFFFHISMSPGGSARWSQESYWHMGSFGRSSQGRTEGRTWQGRRGWIDTISMDGQPVIQSPHQDSISVFTLINTSSEGGPLIFLQGNLIHSGRKPTCNPEVFSEDIPTLCCVM